MQCDTDRQWEGFGKLEPYYAVLTENRFKREQLTKEHLSAFFASGQAHCRDVLEKIRCHIVRDFQVRKALDFGCGVGRTLIPLAQFAQEVVGIDISSSMLAEARRNIADHRLHNITLIDGAKLDAIEGGFDFVHSFIVFQHIPVSRGELVFGKIISLTAPNGIAAIHFPYATAKFKAKIYNEVARKIPYAHNVWNLLKGRNWSYPVMQMYNYHIPRLLEIAWERQMVCRYIEMLHQDEANSHKSCILFLQRETSGRR